MITLKCQKKKKFFLFYFIVLKIRYIFGLLYSIIYTEINFLIFFRYFLHSNNVRPKCDLIN